MDNSNSLVQTALIGLVFVLAVGGTKVVNSAPAEDTIQESDPAEDAPVDPIVAFCQGSHGGNYSHYYDCACFDEHAPPVRAAWSEQARERYQNQLASVPTPEMISRWEEELEDDSKSERDKALLRQKIQRGKLDIQQLEMTAPPGPMDMPLPNLFNDLAGQGVCRTGDNVEVERYDNCMEGFQHRFETDGELENYCQCVGRTIADKWTSGEISLHSQAMSFATQQAWKSCGQ